MKRLVVGLMILMVVLCANRADGDGFVAPQEPATPNPVAPRLKPVEPQQADDPNPELINRPMFSIDVGTPIYFTATYSGDGERLATVANRNELLLVDATTGKTILRADTQSEIFSAQFAPDGENVILTGRDGLRMIDFATGKQFRTIMQGSHTRCDINSNGRTLVVGTMNGATIWDTTTWKQLGKLIPDQRGWFSSVMYRADGKQLLTCGFRDSKVKIWDTKSLENVASFDMERTPIYTAVIDPTGSKVAATSMSHVRMWDADTGKELLVLMGHNRYCVAFSPDGQLLATVDRDHVISVRRSQNGRELFRLKGHEKTVLSVAFSPDGQHLASTSQDGTVKVWEWSRMSSSDSN